MEASISINPVVDAYIEGVTTGSLVVGGWIRKAIQRHKRDLLRTDIKFDPVAANYVIDFCQTYCIPSAQATPIELMPWQQMCIAIIYGWKRLDGYRRFRRVYLEVAKKNGKTGLMAPLGLYHLIADGELSARVYIAATTREQANICFGEAVSMRDKNPELQELIQKYGNNPVLSLSVSGTGSRLSPMTRDASSQDGAVVSAAILDELHRWKKTDSIWSILRFGGDTRKQPMLLCLTTAGASANKSSLCWDEHEYGTRILDGLQEDDEVCPFIFSLDAKDDIKDERNWVKPNPSLGTILPLSALQNQFKEAVGKPTAMGEYKRYRLNIWTDEAADPAIEIENWDECCIEDVTTHPDRKRLRGSLIETLIGRVCFGGVDLAPKLDTSALVLVFPPTKTGEKWVILEYFWCPQDNVQDRVKRDKVSYDLWAQDGFIVLTPGNLTDVRFIADELTAISEKFDLKEIYYDESWSHELIRMLGESGFKMSKLVSFPQTPFKMNPACQELMRKVLRKEFAHSGNPVMRWQMNNLRWNTQKGSGFLKPDRDRKREKVDGCSSLLMALASATSDDNMVKPKREFYAVTA